jgi:hypothetical protein
MLNTAKTNSILGLFQKKKANKYETYWRFFIF